jgi:hypothetical protein
MSDRQFYLNNKNLKAAGVEIEYTPEQIQELVKCSKDPTYFIRTYMKIVHVDHGLVPFDMWDFQEKMVDVYQKNRFSILKCPRQVGKSTVTVAYFLWYILFHPSVTIGLFAQDAATAQEMLGRLQLAYEHLPRWIQVGIVTWNKRNIELENGSKIYAFATGAASARGRSYNIIYLDEFAFVLPHIQIQFYTSVYPTISSGKSTKVIITSTPNGMDLFYRLWTDSVEGRNEFANFGVHWSEVPGRDAEWKRQEIANTSEEQFRQEHETEFLGSTNTLISPEKLKTMAYVSPVYSRDSLDLYEEPKDDHKYVMTVDVARGSGLDYSAFAIVDVTNFPYKLVGKYQDNNIPAMLFPEIIARIGRQYNKADIVVEVNDLGEQVADILFEDLEYENIILFSTRGRAGQVAGVFGGKTTAKGVRMSDKVKSLGCSNLKSFIEEDKLIVQDYETINEFFTFVHDGKNYSAEVGCNDDLVICLVIFSWYTSQQYFKESTDANLRDALFRQKINAIEEDVMPFGYIEDGRDRDDGYWKLVRDDEDEDEKPWLGFDSPHLPHSPWTHL